jgi:hypothetical protein
MSEDDAKRIKTELVRNRAIETNGGADDFGETGAGSFGAD